MPINIIYVIYRPTLNNDIYKIKQLLTLTSITLSLMIVCFIVVPTKVTSKHQSNR